MCLLSVSEIKNEAEIDLDFKLKSQYGLPFTMIHNEIYDLTNFKHPVRSLVKVKFRMRFLMLI